MKDIENLEHLSDRLEAYAQAIVKGKHSAIYDLPMSSREGVLRRVREIQENQ